MRLCMIDEWSLWEDEETTIYFSQNVEKPYPSSFPLFFALLNQVFAVTGASALAGRGVATAFGVLSIALTYVLGARLVSRNAGLIAALFVSMSLGHMFWSQSVRYYTLVLALQLLCLVWFWVA